MASHNAPLIDIWFPVYTGSLDEPLSLECFSFVVVQVKTKEQASGTTPFPPHLLRGDLSSENGPAGSQVKLASLKQAPIFIWLEMGSMTPPGRKTKTTDSLVQCSRHPSTSRSTRPVEWWEVRTLCYAKAQHPVLQHYHFRNLGHSTSVSRSDRTSDYLGSVQESILKTRTLRC